MKDDMIKHTDLVDFSECNFIDREMWFLTYDEFCINREILKRHFWKLSKNGRLFYCYYVYANTHMEIKFKDAIWDYLNGDQMDAVELLRLLRYYKSRLASDELKEKEKIKRAINFIDSHKIEYAEEIKEILK